MPSFRYELRCEGRVAGIDEAGAARWPGRWSPLPP